MLAASVSRSSRSPMKLDSSSTEIACRSSLPSMRRRQAAATSAGRPCRCRALRVPDARRRRGRACVSRVNRA